MSEEKVRGSFETRENQTLNRIKRGIVTPPGDIELGARGFHMSQTMDPLEMLYLSLYWDEIIIPTGFIHINVPFEQELMDCGILCRPHSSTILPTQSSLTEDGGLDAISHDLYAFGEIVKDKINLEKEDWVIQHYSKDPVYAHEHRVEQNNLRLRISNILPIPALTDSFNLADLLEFKYRRRDQLGELHQSMDELLKRIYIEPIPAIKEAEIIRFENAIKELDKPIIERFKIIKKSDWEVSLSPDIPTILENAPKVAGGIFLDSSLNMSFPIATTITSLASVFSLSKTYGFTFNQFAKDDLKLEYISGAKSENIIP